MKLSMPVPAQTDAFFVFIVVLDAWKCSLGVPCDHGLSIPLFMFPTNPWLSFYFAVCFLMCFLCIVNRPPSRPITQWLAVAVLFLLVAMEYTICSPNLQAFHCFHCFVDDTLPLNFLLRFTYFFWVLALDVYQGLPEPSPRLLEECSSTSTEAS